MRLNSYKLERNYLSTSVLRNDAVSAKGDSGATLHYISIEDSIKCLKKYKKYNRPALMLPDAGTITPTLQG